MLTWNLVNADTIRDRGTCHILDTVWYSCEKMHCVCKNQITTKEEFWRMLLAQLHLSRKGTFVSFYLSSVILGCIIAYLQVLQLFNIYTLSMI